MSGTDADSRKRQRPSSDKGWKKDLPAFLDASASVSAATYGARRLPEIKAVWEVARPAHCSAVDNMVNEYKSGGGKTSSRHLRRRTTSHRPRKRHRYPSSRGPLRDSMETDETQGETNSISKEKKQATRRMRRKLPFLRTQHESWGADDDTSSTPPATTNLFLSLSFLFLNS